MAVHAHSGFLNSAEALEPMVSKWLKESLEKGGIKHVVFTGHSAGGAVASLMFLHYLCKASSDCTYPASPFAFLLSLLSIIPS